MKCYPVHDFRLSIGTRRYEYPLESCRMILMTLSHGSVHPRTRESEKVEQMT